MYTYQLILSISLLICLMAQASPLSGSKMLSDDLDVSSNNDFLSDSEQLDIENGSENQEANTEIFRPARERKQSIEKYRKMLQSLIRKGSLYNTLPIDADVFDQYMTNYVSNNEKRFGRSEKLNAKVKKAACGQLSGNPMHKWMCW